METDVYCIVFGEKENFFMSTLIHLLKKYIRDLAEKRPGVYINMGIGYWVDDIRKLQYAADTAVQALEYRFVLGRNQVFHIHDYADKDLSDYTRFDYFEKKLADCLKAVISAVLTKSAEIPELYGEPWYQEVISAFLCHYLFEHTGVRNAPMREMRI